MPINESTALLENETRQKRVRFREKKIKTTTEKSCMKTTTINDRSYEYRNEPNENK